MPGFTQQLPLKYVMRRDGIPDSVKSAVASDSSWRPSSLLRGHHLIDSGASGINCICLRNAILCRRHYHARLYRNQRHIASSFEIGHLWFIWLREIKHSLVYLWVIAWHSGNQEKPASIPIDITHAAEVQHFASYPLRGDEAYIVPLEQTIAYVPLSIPL